MRPILRFGILAFTISGCQPAARYSSPTEKGAAKPPTPAGDTSAVSPLSPDLMWKDDHRQAPRKSVRIVFVHEETDPAAWNGLKSFWTKSTDPTKAAGAANTKELPQAPVVVAPDTEVIKIKVPRGLDDPTPFVPADNPPTLPKWELGRDLFFDKTWLTADGKVSCASCHIPDQGFTDGIKNHDGLRTPTLFNVVYNSSQFWDGRATHLEEVFARSLEDERTSGKTGPFHHTWGGAVGRLLVPESKFWRRFEPVFATSATQDAVGKALATYLRTLLSGASLHDRAVAEQARHKGKELGAGDYEKVLDDADLKVLDRDKQPKIEVADELILGYRLFHNRVPERKLNCVNCHGGRQFTDGKFHNVGVGDRVKMVERPYPGRFAHVPIGLKDRTLIGAYKTPTLRGLSRTGPYYFHNGDQETLTDALSFHTQRFPWNSFLAAEMIEEGNPSRERHLNLSAKESKALLLFLTALNGTAVDAAVLPAR